MQKSLLTVALLMASTGAAADWAVKGEGNYNCPQYLSARRSNSAELYSSVTWVQGFISGINRQRAADGYPDAFLGADFPATSIVRWLENHCRENLQDDLADAAAALVDELGAASQSEP